MGMAMSIHGRAVHWSWNNQASAQEVVPPCLLQSDLVIRHRLQWSLPPTIGALSTCMWNPKFQLTPSSLSACIESKPPLHTAPLCSIGYPAMPITLKGRPILWRSNKTWSAHTAKTSNRNMCGYCLTWEYWCHPFCSSSVYGIIAYKIEYVNQSENLSNCTWAMSAENSCTGNDLLWLHATFVTAHDLGTSGTLTRVKLLPQLNDTLGLPVQYLCNICAQTGTSSAHFAVQLWLVVVGYSQLWSIASVSCLDSFLLLWCLN